MATVIEAPAPVVFRDYPAPPSLFLAGGITDCPDWQAEAIDLLDDVEATILNPRRLDFDVRDPNASDVQVEWEFEALRRADVILFWFPSDTLCPITLYELGAWSTMDTPLAVGTHPDYARRYDVVKQTSLIRAEVNVMASLAATVEVAKDRLREFRNVLSIQWLTPPI